jgi:hypothetical protein
VSAGRPAAVRAHKRPAPADGAQEPVPLTHAAGEPAGTETTPAPQIKRLKLTLATRDPAGPATLTAVPATLPTPTTTTSSSTTADAVATAALVTVAAVAPVPPKKVLYKKTLDGSFLFSSSRVQRSVYPDGTLVGTPHVACMYILVGVCMCVCLYLCVYGCVHIYTCVYACVHIYTCVYACVRVCVCACVRA